MLLARTDSDINAADHAPSGRALLPRAWSNPALRYWPEEAGPPSCGATKWPLWPTIRDGDIELAGQVAPHWVAALARLLVERDQVVERLAVRPRVDAHLGGVEREL